MVLVSLFQRKFKAQFVALALVLAGCYYDKEAILYPASGTCIEVPNPTFRTDILPILNARCNNCHAGSAPSADIKLDTYTDVMPYVNSGSLMGSINHASGFSAMPKNESKLNPCQIQKIQNWITTGAVNN